MVCQIDFQRIFWLTFLPRKLTSKLPKDDYFSSPNCPYQTHFWGLSLIQPHWSLCMQGSWILAPFNIKPRSPGSLNYFLDAPQINFQCFLFSPCSPRIFGLLPISFPRFPTPSTFFSAPRSLKWIRLPWSLGFVPSGALGSLVVLDPFLPALYFKTPCRGSHWGWYVNRPKLLNQCRFYN